MISKSFLPLLSALVLANYASAQAIVNSPSSLIECQPAAITWSGASGSVYLSVHEGTDTSAAAVETFPTQTGASGSYTWTVDIASGTSVSFYINDDTGAINYSSSVTIQSGTDSSCLTSSSSTSAAVAATSSVASTGSSAATGATTSSASTSASTSKTSTKTSSTSNKSSSSTSSAATSSADDSNATSTVSFPSFGPTALTLATLAIFLSL